MSRFEYKNENLREVRFPMGGIGAGSVSIDGGARLCDWEIKNRPNKESLNGCSFIALKAEKNGCLLSAKALNGPLQGSYMGKGLHSFGGYTYGPQRESLVGVPHFDEVTLLGRFPVAEYDFSGDFPAVVKLTAWSPFEPGNDFDSSLPLAMFEISLENNTSSDMDYSVAFTVANPNNRPKNKIIKSEKNTMLLCDTRITDVNNENFGQLALITDSPETSYQANWFRGAWFDGLNTFWQDFCGAGKLINREEPPHYGNPGEENGSICVHLKCPAGEKVSVNFALSWYYPNYVKYWGENEKWRNWYSTKFAGAKDVAIYALQNRKRMFDAAYNFVDLLYNSSMPEEVIDAAGATLSVLKSPTCVRLTDGSFYGWEGSHARDGSCEGSCQHVWNYQYALPMLFGNLERSMRELDFKYNLRPDGSMAFRLILPVGAHVNKHRACVDGQMGAIIKTYRDWKLCGDNKWLAGLWDSVKKALEFTWSPENPDKWDSEKQGCISGRQHHTLDMELFGVNSWLSSMYLAALCAAEVMAEAMKDYDFAGLCREIFERGREYCDKYLFNGEYYCHLIDIKDKSVLEKYIVDGSSDDFVGIGNDDVIAAYWNNERGEIKYQIGEGCSIDQMLGQWHADLCGLGAVMDDEKVKKALGSIYKYNYKNKLGDIFNPCRIYGLENEAGTLICSYPDGKQRPNISVPYAEETMHGFEYSAASLMMLRGLYDEALCCIRAVRDRYDGRHRNPWNEIECGGNYARSMAAWSFVMAYQGLHVDMCRKTVCFAPLEDDLRSIWAFSGAWGKVEISRSYLEFSVSRGSISLRKFGFPQADKVGAVLLNGNSLDFDAADGQICFREEINLNKNDVLKAI